MDNFNSELNFYIAEAAREVDEATTWEDSIFEPRFEDGLSFSDSDY